MKPLLAVFLFTLLTGAAAVASDPLPVAIRDASGEHRLEIGSGDWTSGHTTFDSDQERPYAASGAWTSEDTYVVKLCFYTTPWRPTLTFQFGGKLVVYDFEYKASFGPTKRPQRVGRAD